MIMVISCIVHVHVRVLYMHKLKGARTYCIINEAAPSGVVAMDYFSSLKASINVFAHLQHYLAYVLLLCKNSVG